LKSTKAKKDKRKAYIECPLGSGKKFKTQGQLDKWMVSDDNLYRPELVAGRDYVCCAECGGRFRKLGIHLARTHKISEEEYLEQHPGLQIVATSESEKIANRLGGKERGVYKKKIGYRLPDGSIVRRKPAWERAWKGNGPADSILDLSLKEFTG